MIARATARLAALLALAATLDAFAASDGPSFVAPEDQPAVEASTIERLENLEATEETLRTAAIARDGDGTPIIETETERGERTKIRFRITFETADGERIEGLFKARQRNYRDWIGELLSYRLGRALDLRLTPVVERRIARSDLETALAEAGPGFADLLDWEEGDDGPFVRGALQYWVPGFRFRIGEFNANPDGLDRLTAWAGHRNLDLAASEPVLQDLTGVLLLDFLVFNEDRHHNVGSVRRPDDENRSILLVPIDFGDSLYNPARRNTRCRRLLWRVEVFPRALVERLRALEPDAIRALLRSEDGGPAVSDAIADAVIERRERALGRIDELVDGRGEDRVLY